jgi:signal transduction histidine kinase
VGGQVPVVTEQGLAAALEAFTARCPVPVRLTITTIDRFLASIGATAYFAVSEALTNVAKHSGATVATVSIQSAECRLP